MELFFEEAAMEFVSCRFQFGSTTANFATPFFNAIWEFFAVIK
jgi:hypothetical protein